LILVALATSLAGCPPPSSSPTASHDRNSITLRALENPTTLDPAYATRTFEGHLACLLHAGLVRCGEDGSICLELAESWDVQSGSSTFRFNLREGLRFPSGRPFTAEDVVMSFSRICLPETASPHAAIFSDVLGYQEIRSGTASTLQGVQAIGPQTVEVRLESPSVTLLPRLTMPAARVVDQGEVDREALPYGRRPKGLGAWEMVEWVDDSHLILRPNPLYPDRNQHLAELRFQIAPQDFTAASLFETGRLDVLHPLPFSQRERWLNHPQWQERILQAEEMNVYYLGFGCHRPPLDRPEVRRAIRSALHPDRFMKALYGNLALPANGPIPPGLTGYRNSKELSTESSTDLSGLSLELWFVESDSTTSLAMEAIQADLAASGIRCRLRKTDPATYGRWRREGRFDLFFANWWADYPDPDNFISPLFLTGSASNFTRFADPETDTLIHLGERESTPLRREEIYHRIQDRLDRLTPAVFLWHRRTEILTQPWVEGYRPAALFHGTLLLNLQRDRG
jgi:ABC-type transport system substrate-binding protein